MWRSAFLSLISLAACSDGTGQVCGYGSASSNLGLTAGSASLNVSDLTASANNDCPDPMAPAGVISLTIERPLDGLGLFTLCIPRPDKLSAGLQLGTDVKLIDVTISFNSCMYMLDSSMLATGTAKGTGVCKNGSDALGFALTLDGTIPLKRTCSGTTDAVTATVSGTIAVTSQ